MLYNTRRCEDGHSHEVERHNMDDILVDLIVWTEVP